MARRKRKKKELLDYIALPRIPSFEIDDEVKKSIWMIFVIALGVLSILGIFGLSGIIGQYLNIGFELLFGKGSLVMPFILLAVGFSIALKERFDLNGVNFFGLFFLVIISHAIIQLFVPYELWGTSIQAGIGGGYIGLFMANIFMQLMGFWASLIISFCFLLVSLMLMFNTSLSGIFGREGFFGMLFAPFFWLSSKIFGNKDEDGDEEDNEEEEEEEEGEDEEEEEEENEEEESEDEEEDDEENEEEEEDGNEDEGGDEENKEEGSEPDIISSFNSKTVSEDPWWYDKFNVDLEIPMKLLNVKKGKPTSGDTKENSDIIKTTLANFGIQVEMGGIQVGPTVTQYTFKPANGVKLSRITSLNNDLALALAAHTIRIEAPIPGKSLVGVEVPNEKKAMVTMKEILRSPDYEDRKSDLMIALGKDISGKAWLYDVAKMPHLLVAGQTNSGKSVCLNALIVSLLYQNSPDNLRFIMIDPKRVEMSAYNGIPHLLAPVINDVAKTINALKWCVNEMDKRYDILSQSGAKNIQSYNKKAKIKMPYIVFVVDELADLMVMAAKDIETGIIRLAQKARAVGIHLILATQRPSVDVITGLIKANMPARIAFAVASGMDSRTILDSLGAEKLLGQGDMLLKTAEMSGALRIQGAFLGDDEIKNIVAYIKKKIKETKFIDNVTDKQKVAGMGGVGIDSSGDEDELLGEAKEIVINMGKASATLLQRKLSIGYARAAKILDILEELGIVGPSNGAKGREILMSREQYAAMEDQLMSGMSLHSKEDSKAPDNFLGDDKEEITGVPPVFASEDDKESEEEDELDDDEEEEENEDDDNKDDNEDDDDDKKKNKDENNEEDDDSGFYAR